MALAKRAKIQDRETYWPANIFRFFRGEWAERCRLFTLTWCSYFHRFKTSERKSPVNDLWWQPWFTYWFYRLSLCALRQPTTAAPNHVTRWFHHFTTLAHGEKDIWSMKYMSCNFVFVIMDISFGELLYKVNLKPLWTKYLSVFAFLLCVLNKVCNAQ